MCRLLLQNLLHFLIHNILSIILTYFDIVDTDGAIVDGVADHNGHRKGHGPGHLYHERLPPVPVKKVANLELHADDQEALRKIDRKERPKRSFCSS